MKTISTGNLSGERVAKRIVLLAYEASVAVGLGVLQARSGVTEESLGACIWGDQVDADYIAGRMVKLWGVSFGPNSITFNDLLVPRADYQSWCWDYPTYEALVMAAIESLRALQPGARGAPGRCEVKRKKMKPVRAWAAVRFGFIEPHMVFSEWSIAAGWAPTGDVVKVEIREAPKRRKAVRK